MLAEELQTALTRTRDITLKDLSKKNVFHLLASTTEELGEFSRELKIEQKVHGNTYKKPDEGTKAEAVDLIICALSLFYACGGTNAQMLNIMEKKLDKWENSV